MAKRTVEHKASNTAGYTCFARACTAREKDERFRGLDNLAEIFETVARAGEGWTFGIEAEAIERFLSERGLELLSHHTPSDLEAAYLTADDGTRFGRINGTHCIAIATVRDQADPAAMRTCAVPS